MKFITFLIHAVLAFLLFSCNGNSSSTSPITAFDIFPLTAGNYWAFNAYLGNDTINVHELDSASIGNSQTIHQLLCYPMTTWYRVNGGAWTVFATYYCLNETDGFHSFIDTTRSNGTVLNVMFPVTVGDSWDILSYSHTVCESVTDAVTTPAGTFTNCVRCKVSYSNYFSRSWYKPGVGEVRTVYYNLLESIDSLRTLRTYHLSTSTNYHSGENG